MRDIENARNALIDRLREDYQIELAAEYAASAGRDDTLGETNAVNIEIGQLKDKIRRLGNVSLESLQELADVEVRAKELQSQLDDLTSAHGSLLEIITKINTDSRKLFTEIYEHVRTHFRSCFASSLAAAWPTLFWKTPRMS